ncbi:transcriptional regulator, LacI family [Tranquillimonas rosea]|uniref:Transcriptional regulator, LacI family n=1 Tax=Tranquillimonas rosea TaxID=641238 RepID=A0A1H9XBM1_9RHOB|nr:LacI family DNA-binding transcriptional regulator [Tranquillimonas rosea]SES43053.1 transcriptional regulator, LacI family [Tranquillimonas rosea]
MKRPTISDVARAAGVSVATVDRVLSGRARVREETARKVQQAAEDVGYHGVNAIRSRIRTGLPELSVGVVLQKERHSFYQSFVHELETQAAARADRNVRLTIRFARSTRPEEQAELLLGLKGHVDAVASTGIDHHEVTAAVQELRDAGIPTFSMLSDFAQGVRESYLGLNNLRLGRTAGWLISHIAARPGKIGIFIGAHRYHGHELREAGLRSYLREYGPGFELLEAQVNLETRELTYEATGDLLSRQSDLAGLYVAGGGMEGAIEAFEKAGPPPGCALLVNELTPESYRGLQNGTVSIVFGTPIRQIVAELLSLAASTVDQGQADTPGQRFFTPDIYTPESLA